MNETERRDTRHNACGEGLWGLGMGVVAPLTVMPLLIRRLGGGGVEVGLVYSIASAGFMLLQPVGMLFCREGAGKKRFLLAYHWVLALPAYVGIAAAMMFLGAREETLGLTRMIVIALFAARVLGIGAIIPIWQDWLAGIFSVRTRGRALGIAGAASALGLAAGSLIAGIVRERLNYPVDYTVLFLVSVVFGALSLPRFARMSDGSPRPGSTGRPRVRELLALFAHSLSNKHYRRYLVGRMLMTLGAGAGGFLALRFRSPDGGGLSEAAIIAFGAFLTLPQAIGSYWLGSLGDRFGHRVGILAGCVAQVLALGVAVLWGGTLACVLCFVCVGVAIAANWVSHQNMIFETCPHDNRIAHITLSNLVLSPLLVLVPLGTGWLVDHIGMTLGIGVCLVPSIVGTLWMAFMVRDPRQVVLA